MTNLFQHKKFTLHSGGTSHFKIECDALTKEDYATLAKVIAKRFKFRDVIGVPRGGIPFEEALRAYVSDDNNNLLIVDDVLTTGSSMEEMKKQCLDKGFENIFGVTVFARGTCPSWIEPVFTLREFFAKDV